MRSQCCAGGKPEILWASTDEEPNQHFEPKDIALKKKNRLILFEIRVIGWGMWREKVFHPLVPNPDDHHNQS